MELLDDHIIQNKINSLLELPEGIEPNLESKWELIEAGLNEGKKKNRVLGWYKIAVAAMLLMMGAGSLLLLRPQPQPKSVVSQEVITTPDVPLVKEEQAISKPAKRVKNPVKTVRKPQQLVVMNEVQSIDTTTPSTIDLPAPVISEVAIVPKVKKARYVEMDFNDQPFVNTVPSETVLAAQQFRFKINFRSVSSSGGASSEGSFKLHKSIN